MNRTRPTKSAPAHNALEDAVAQAQKAATMLRAIDQVNQSPIIEDAP